MADKDSQRLDKWLWYARFFKTRTAATKLIQSGKLRIDGNVNHKPHRAAIIGMVLTFPKANDIRVIKIVQLGERRGPAGEALSLYEDLSPKINETKKTRWSLNIRFKNLFTPFGERNLLDYFEILKTSPITNLLNN